MSENSIHGKLITKEQAYEGLGDPSTWAADEEKLKNEMQQKHKKKVLCSVENPLNKTLKWEFFCDASYFDYWAVREIGEIRWGHCYHLCQRSEAESLCNLLNSLT